MRFCVCSHFPAYISRRVSTYSVFLYAQAAMPRLYGVQSEWRVSNCSSGTDVMVVVLLVVVVMVVVVVVVVVVVDARCRGWRVKGLY